MTNNRTKNSIEVSKMLYSKDKEIYFLGFSYLGLCGFLKSSSFLRARLSKAKNSTKLVTKVHQKTEPFNQICSLV